MNNLVLKLAKIRCYTYFWLGDYWSKTFMEIEFMHWTYPVYYNLMGWSCEISDKYDLGVWSPIEEGEDNE